jgi:hypothetical protein
MPLEPIRLYKAPLSKEDAETIAHAAEVYTLIASMPSSTLDDAANYGEARHWIIRLLCGEEVGINEALLAESRRIMTKEFG